MTFGFRAVDFAGTRVRVAAFFGLVFVTAARFAALRLGEFPATAFFAGDLRAERFFTVRDFAAARFFLVAMTCASVLSRAAGAAALASLAPRGGAVNL